MFSEVNELPLYVSNWVDLKIGPLLRDEKVKRLYWGYINEPNSLSLVRRTLFFLQFRKSCEPELKKVEVDAGRNPYLFRRTPSDQDYFSVIREHKDKIRRTLFNILSSKMVDLLDRLEPPVIGVHVRRSDFHDPRAGENLGNACNLRTPLWHYVNLVESIRRIHGKELFVTVFTDGGPSEVGELLELKNVHLAENRPAIVDMILLSRSRCIIVSPKSTFSYWSAFLSDAPVITHPLHPAKIRPERVRKGIFEGPFSESHDKNAPLVENLREINA